MHLNQSTKLRHMSATIHINGVPPLITHLGQRFTTANTCAHVLDCDKLEPPYGIHRAFLISQFANLMMMMQKMHLDDSAQGIRVYKT